MMVLAGVQLHAQTNDVLPPIVRNLEGDVRPIAIRSDNAQVQKLVLRAFDVHGAYSIAEEERADFVFSFTPAGANSVTLEILSGKPLQSLYKNVVQGADLADAALRAADLAVAKTSGLRGIFAGKLVFVGQRGGATELYMGGLLFDNVTQLTRDNAQCVRPSLSPDGSTILYTSYYRNGFPDIYSIDVASGRREVFLSFNGVNTGATFSPDGRTVAMILSGTGNAELYTINSQRKDMRRLTTNKSLESDPSWSPDGRQIVFASDMPGKPQIYVMSASGGNMRRLPTNISNFCSEPAWNPVDEDLIAFTISQGSSFEVALYNMVTGESRTISQGAGDAVEPTWTRDGRHLVYTERTPNRRRLVLLDTLSGHKAYLNSAEWGDASQADYVYP
jgi:TolB protein